MSLKKRWMALALSASMLVSPVASLAEGTSGFSAGDLTPTAIRESYAGGMQLNVTARLGVELDEDVILESKSAQALVSLLGKSVIELSFYDDFGTARVRGALITEGVTLCKGDALFFEDGSMQLMTSLTGKYVLTLPAGTLSGDAMAIIERAAAGESDSTAMARLKEQTGELSISLLNMLLGWVSGTQVDTEELYIFDNTPIEATETRDEVAQRMIGTINTCDFMALLWNIVATIRDDEGEFLQAVADTLAEAGVTRYQVHKLTDELLTEETIDPATDFVQTTWAVGNDGSLCELNDVQYFMRKLEKSVDNLWNLSTDNKMSMIVSYDDNGGTVGFDAVVPLISEGWPFEGDFTYSIKTDEHGQRLHTSHGELQVYDNNRIVGDLNIRFGQDVDGVKQSSIAAVMDVNNSVSGASVGMGVSAGMTSTIGVSDTSEETEHFESNALLELRVNGEGIDFLSASLSGQTVLGADTLTLDATAAGWLTGLGTLIVDAHVEQTDYEGEDFAGGIAVDMTSLDSEQLDAIQNEVVGKVAMLSMSLMLHPGVVADLTALVGNE